MPAVRCWSWGVFSSWLASRDLGTARPSYLAWVGPVVLSTRKAMAISIIGSIGWWRHQMETFSALLAICGGNSPVTGEFPAQRPVSRGFDVFFDLRPNKRLSKQSWGWWFETPSRPLWRHRNKWLGFEIQASRHYLHTRTHRGKGVVINPSRINVAI